MGAYMSWAWPEPCRRIERPQLFWLARSWFMSDAFGSHNARLDPAGPVTPLLMHMFSCCVTDPGNDQIIVNSDMCGMQETCDESEAEFAIFGLCTQTAACHAAVKHVECDAVDDKHTKEKQRLKALTEDFFGRAQRGIELAIVDEVSGGRVGGGGRAARRQILVVCV